MILSAKGGVIGFLLAGYIIVSADVAHLCVVIHKALVVLFVTVNTAFTDSNPHKYRQNSSVIEREKAWRYYWKNSEGPQRNHTKTSFC